MRLLYTPKVTEYPWRKTFVLFPVRAYDKATNSEGYVWWERVWHKSWWDPAWRVWRDNYRTLESMDA